MVILPVLFKIFCQGVEDLEEHVVDWMFDVYDKLKTGCAISLDFPSE